MKHDVPTSGTLDRMSYCWRCGASYTDDSACPGSRGGHEPHSTANDDHRYAVFNTWNGGAGGVVVLFVAKQIGVAGQNECFEWIHKNTPFSYYEATTHQGYKVERWGDHLDVTP